MNKYQEYWKARNEAMFLKGEKDILDFAEELEKNYKKAIRNLEDQINIFYGKYAREAQMSISDVKKLLNKSELKSFKEYIKDMRDYAKSHNMENSYIRELKLTSLKSRISRLEELKVKMRFEVEKLNNEITLKMQGKLSDVYEEGYYKTHFNFDKLVGISSSFTELNTPAILKAIRTNYMTENYSQVLWRNKNTLLNILNQKIPQGIMLGQNPNKVASIASKQLGSNYKATVRLVRTEYNLILNDAAAKSYSECGLDRYQLLATLDDRTSEICQDMDMQIFFVKDKEVGVNYPPFHPNCRTTTIPYFEPDEFDETIERIARDNKGDKYMVPGNISYRQWKSGLVKGKDGVTRYKS